MAEVRNDLRHIQRFFNLLKLPTCLYGAASGIQERLAFLPRRAGCEAPSSLRGCDPPEALLRLLSSPAFKRLRTSNHPNPGDSESPALPEPLLRRQRRPTYPLPSSHLRRPSHKS